MEADPVPLSIFVLTLVLLTGTALAESSLFQVGRAELRKLGEDGNDRAKGTDQLLQDADRVQLALVLLKTASLLVAGGALIASIPAGSGPVAALVLLACLWLGVSVAQVALQRWAKSRATSVALALTPLVQVVTLVLWPLTALIQRLKVSGSIDRHDEPNGQVVLSEEELRRLIGVRESDQPLQVTEMQMIASVLELEETVAREVMVPRIDMVTLSVETRLEQALGTIIDAGHSRIPVYEDDTDHVVGFLYAKDLLTCFQNDQADLPIRDLLRPAYFVPASKKVNTLMREMQRDRVHIAMVVDEYGGIAGLVTIEDILEEIVGEIQDEYDMEEEVYVQVLEPNVYLLNARLDLYSVGKLLDCELPDEGADTLGGLIYSVLGHVPEPGESLEVAGWRFTVLSLEGRRIEEVRAEPVAYLLDTGEAREDEATLHDADATRSSSPVDSTSNPALLNYSGSD